MTATNHALTGTAIGLIVGEPWLALPLALLSHYICDILPHWRLGTVQQMPDLVLLNTRTFRNYLITDATICILIVVVLAIIRPDHWLLAAVCAFVATSPDLASINRFITNRHKKKKYRRNLYERFADRIQWFERPIGAVVEIAWLIAALAVIAPFIR